MDKESINDSILDKLQLMSVKPSENVEGIRSAVSKLHWKVSSPDKQVRLKTIDRIWRKGQGGLPLLLGLIESVRDLPTIGSIAGIIHECISVRAGKNRNPALNELIQLNASHILIKILHQAHCRDHLASNEAMGHELLWSISQLAQRDSKFSLKTRLLGAVKTFHYFLKLLYNNTKLVFPTLLIIKALVRNTNTATVLAKDGLIVTMEKVLTSLGLRASTKLRLSLNILTHLSKNKLCCARLVQSHCVSHLLKVIERWDRYEGKLRIKLVYHAVVSLQRVCYLKLGRKAVTSLSGLSVLYKFCQACPEDKAYDSIFSRVCNVINYCLERRFLPLDDPSSPLTFQLPSANNNIVRRLSHDDFAEYDDGDSEDELGEDGEEEEGVAQVQGFDHEYCKLAPQVSPPRHKDDLLMYSSKLDHLLPARKNSLEQHRKRVATKEILSSSIGAGDCPVNTKCNAAGKVTGLELLKNPPSGSDPCHMYLSIASRVRSVLPIIKVAYPDLHGATGIGLLEPLHVKDLRSCRQQLRTSVEKAMNQTDYLYEVVYDLDLLTTGCQASQTGARVLQNDDKRHIGKRLSHHYLHFESRFESGNLRKAVQVQESLLGRPGWVRTGREICYYSNSYRKSCGQHKCYFTATFTVDFPHDYDVCYLSYHYPYTYSHLMKNIRLWSQTAKENKVLFRADSLCETLNGNEVPVVTITALDLDSAPLNERKSIFLTGRVHPGESNASWTLDGSLGYLVGGSSAAVALRRQYIFIVIPMLNVEGVINGCSRCGLTNEDLNRRWKSPHPVLHPEIYHAKGLLEYCTRIWRKPPFVFCDFHGHSRKKNIFFYGCASEESWAECDRKLVGTPNEYLLLAHLMSHLCPSFSYFSCKFRVERGREATARVAVWRDFDIKRSYTIEASYCGCDQGPYSGYHLDTTHLQEAGRLFCDALGCLQDESTSRLELPIGLTQANHRVRDIGLPRGATSDSSSEALTEDDLELDPMAL